MNRRDFFGCIGKMLMAGAATVIAPEILEPVPKEEITRWTSEQMEAYLALVRNNKATFTVAS